MAFSEQDLRFVPGEKFMLAGVQMEGSDSRVSNISS